MSRPSSPSRSVRARLAPCATVLVAWWAGVAGAATVAVAPLSDRQGDPATAQAVERGIVAELAASGHRVVDPVEMRNAMRARRLRVLDDAGPEDLVDLASALGADWVLSLTLHQTATAETPRLALSGHAFAGADGALRWCGFTAPSGLDGRTLLGLGVVDDLQDLAERAGRRLSRDFLKRASTGGTSRSLAPSAAGLGRIALLPFGSVTTAAGTNAAETATEIARTLLYRHGAELAPPGRVTSVLRRGGLAWGGVDDDTRRALVAATGARWIVVGSVESYQAGGGGGEPRPRVALALRLLDAESGRITWIGGRERGGWDGAGPFRLGRVYTRGALAERMLTSMVRRLLSEPAGEPMTQRTSP